MQAAFWSVIAPLNRKGMLCIVRRHGGAPGHRQGISPTVFELCPLFSPAYSKKVATAISKLLQTSNDGSIPQAYRNMEGIIISNSLWGFS